MDQTSKLFSFAAVKTFSHFCWKQEASEIEFFLREDMTGQLETSKKGVVYGFH